MGIGARSNQRREQIGSYTGGDEDLVSRDDVMIPVTNRAGANGGDITSGPGLGDGQGDVTIELTYNVGKNDYQLGDQFGHLAFDTDDLDGVIREVESRGWWYRQSRPELQSRYIFVKDPNGYDVEILERR